MTRRPADRPSKVRARAVGTATVLVAGLALTGCATDGPGVDTAVSVGSESVPVSRVVELTEEVAGDEPLAPAARAELQRSIVALLVQQQVYETAAEEFDVQVDQGDVDAQLAAAETAGVDVTEQLRAQGVPPSFVDSYGRLVLLQQGLLQEVGGEQELRELLVSTAQGLDVDVNPRLGEFDAEALAVAPIEPALSSPGPVAPGETAPLVPGAPVVPGQG